MEFTCSKKFVSSTPEIIQIGAVKTNENFDTCERFSRFIKPINNPILTDFCKQLTGISQRDIDRASGLIEVFDEFEKWIGDECTPVFFVWGTEDVRILNSEFDTKQYEGYLKKHMLSSINYQEYVKEFTGTQLSLKNALIMLGSDFEGTEHNALADAINLKNVYTRSLQSKELLLSMSYKTKLEKIISQLERIKTSNIVIDDALVNSGIVIFDYLKETSGSDSKNAEYKLVELKDTLACVCPKIEDMIIKCYLSDVHGLCKKANEKYKYDTAYISKRQIATWWLDIIHKYRFFLKKKRFSEYTLNFDNLHAMNDRIDSIIYRMGKYKGNITMKNFNKNMSVLEILEKEIKKDTA